MITPEKQALKLALYHFDTCPFCVKTRQIIKKTSLDVELKDIRKGPQNRMELLKGGNKTQVPCLRIEQPNGETKWLYESGDIIRFIIAL